MVDNITTPGNIADFFAFKYQDTSIAFDKGEMKTARSDTDSPKSASGNNNDGALTGKKVKQALLH